ncbi:dihydrolipoyl dehydrogenase [Fictibacillus phosphorivorans]|uniref:dihydrolipoyl dehydrogenase n=1 Tax=Fictibacillus phosphorivorans TaxID=1221500 RepID=UPI002041F96C|nr:dihydrolipoyl dehydrogenase [Fictibacillus phosphorivorans]MCM3717442.1 dihydrolipoyl dehydrogenase [Fictibacillus phosphorivorans]MCM3775137.1 dihydrolipoyl dehydrogenase [Fictibacillus phosphorivorans]
MVVGDFATKRQLVIIGGGPGGYHAAIRAAQLGLEVTLIEKEKLGGVCLHKGCIPSKSLTQTAANFSGLSHYRQMGISIPEAAFECETFKSYYSSVVNGLQKGVEALIKANKIEYLTGSASFMSSERIGIDSGHHFEMYEFEHALIATGSSPLMPGKAKLTKRIMTPHTLWELNELPQSLLVYGEDYFALEAAMSYRQLGSEVTLITPGAGLNLDRGIEKELLRVLKKNKIKVFRNHQWESAEESDATVSVTFMKDAEEKVAIDASHVLYAAGYSPNLDGMGLEAINVERDENGFIDVNEHSQTSVSNIYAAGDCTIGMKLASKAIKQGKTAAEHMAGLPSAFNLSLVPYVVHTNPPIATVGLTEEQAKREGYEVKSGQFSMNGNGFASILGQKEGLAKLVIDSKTDVILGIHMMGAGAVEMIQAGTYALEMVAREEDLAYPVYAHPALNEAWLEAVESVSGKAIHVPPAKKKEKSTV